MSFTCSSLEEYFATIQKRFVPEAAKGVNATFMVVLTGKKAGTWTIKVADGTMELIEGPVEKPTVTYTMDSDEYLKMSNGELDGTKAYMLRKLKVAGNLMMAQKYKNIMPPAKA